MAITVGSRDLSADFNGKLQVTIEALGTMMTSYDIMHLADRVAHVAAIMTGKSVVMY